MFNGKRANKRGHDYSGGERERETLWRRCPEVTRRRETVETVAANSYRESWHVPEAPGTRLATLRRDSTVVRDPRSRRGYRVQESEGRPSWGLW